MFIFSWFLRKDPFVIFKPSLHDPGFLFFLAIFALILPIVGFLLKRFLFGRPLRATKDAFIRGTDKTVEKIKVASEASTGAIKTSSIKTWKITKAGTAKAGEVGKLAFRGAANKSALVSRSILSLWRKKRGRRE